jgi:hypothetical protein
MTTSSRSRRQLGGGFGLHRLSIGWTGDLNEIAAVRTHKYSGIKAIHAVHLVADQFCSQPRRQALADLPESHSENLRSSGPEHAAGGFVGAQNPVGEIQNV